MLSPKKTVFYREYVIDHNGARAAIVAGASAKSARFQASKWLADPEVSAAIAEATREIAERCGITKRMIVDELRKVGFSDMRKFAAWDAAGVYLISSTALGDDSAACVSEVSQRDTRYGTSIRFKLHSKVEALEKLARHLGMFVERSEVSGSIDITNYTPEQRQARIEELLKRAQKD